MNEERNESSDPLRHMLGVGQWPGEDEAEWDRAEAELSAKLRGDLDLKQLAWHDTHPENEPEPENSQGLRERMKDDPDFKQRYDQQRQAIVDVEQAMRQAPGQSVWDTVTKDLATHVATSPTPAPSRPESPAGGPWSVHLAQMIKGWSWKQVAAAVILLIVVPTTMGAALTAELRYRAALARFDEFIKGCGLDQPLEYTISGSPVIVAGRRVVVEGFARPGLIKEVRVTVTPSIEDGKEEWTDRKEIQGTGAQPVRFSIRFDAPQDNRVRVVLVEAIPADNAPDSVRKFLETQKLTYTTRIACKATGVTPDYPLPKASQVFAVERHGQSWIVKVRAGTSTGFLTVAVREDGSPAYHADIPLPVSHENQELIFRLLPGTDRFSVTPFATETGSAEELRNAIESMTLNGVERGEEYPVNPAGAGSP